MNTDRYQLGVIFKDDPNIYKKEVKPIYEDYKSKSKAIKDGESLIDDTVKEVLVYDRITGTVIILH